GAAVLGPSEERGDPVAGDAGAAARRDRLAADQGVRIIGGGLNPGLVFDALVLTLLGAAPADCTIEVRRTVDIGRFGATVLRRIGIGRGAESFAAGVKRGEILGHAGFPQSMWVVAAAIGLTLERIETELHPLITPSAADVSGRFVVASGWR